MSLRARVPSSKEDPRALWDAAAPKESVISFPRPPERRCHAALQTLPPKTSVVLTTS